MSAEGTAAAAPAAEPVVILPRKPLLVIAAGEPGAACEGDSCSF